MRSFSKTDKEFQFFHDFWEYIKKYYDAKDTDAYWETMMHDGEVLIVKYGADSTKIGRLAKKILLAVFDYAEGEIKINKAKKENKK